MLPERFQRSIPLFLLLAYPISFLFFQGGRYCEPLCFEPPSTAVFELIVVLLVLMAVSGVVTGVLRFDAREHARKPVHWLLSPAPLASVLLFGVFALFVVFLTLDAMSLGEALWKPVAFPLSFLLFFPVWVLYLASFPLAVLLSVFGIDPPSVVTLAFRGVVITLGFPLSVLFQSLAISAVVDDLQSRSE